MRRLPIVDRARPHRSYDRRIDSNAPPFARYLHITGIPASRLRNRATVYLDASWARDLAHHTYLGDRITVLCPITETDAAPAGYVPFTDDRFEFVALPERTGTVRYLVEGRLARAVARMWRELGRADVMFAGLVEHPVPLGWFAFPMARLRRVVRYTFLESTPWRPLLSIPLTWKSRLRMTVTMPLNALALRLLDFAAVTQPAYADLLPATTPWVLTPASWFLADELATNDALDRRAAAAASRPAGEPPVVLFAGRFDAPKGVRQLLDALDRLDADGLGPITLRVLGAGGMAPEVDACAARLRCVRMERLEPVPYGPEFFRVFDGVDCLVVPNLGDEQPRNILDAASQGVASIASDTTGVCSIVEDGMTATLVPTGSVEALAGALGSLRNNETRLRYVEMGRRAWLAAAPYDHEEMHRRRAEFVAELFRAGLPPRSGTHRRRIGRR
jgi:glycosyltransferase involved in cell wall biosynthesis